MPGFRALPAVGLVCCLLLSCQYDLGQTWPDGAAPRDRGAEDRGADLQADGKGGDGPPSADGAVSADGKVTAPDGKVTAPDGKVTPPDGKVTPPDSKLAQPDNKLLPDLPAPKPKVSLVSPKLVYNTKKHLIDFTFNVVSPVAVNKCDLLLDGKVAGTAAQPSGVTVVTHGPVGVGKKKWTVHCETAAGQKFQAGQSRYVYGGFETLKGCKTSGWSANTWYRLLLSIKDLKSGCFVVDKEKVLLDGHGKALTSARRKDLVYYRVNGTKVSVLGNRTLKGKGNGLWVTGWQSPYGSAGSRAVMTAADFDGDGDLDLVTHSFNSPLRLFSNDGTGGFGAAAAWSPGATDKLFNMPRPFDFDGDGKLDLLLAHGNGPERLYRGNGTTAGLSQALSVSMGDRTYQLDLGDLDGDGAVDVISGNTHHSTVDARHHVLLSRNTRKGMNMVPGWASQATEDNGPGHSFLADFDDDGDWDLVTPRNHGGTDRVTYVRLNNGKGTAFTQAHKVPASEPLAALDMDKDGDTDLLVGHISSSSGNQPVVQVILNDGKGKFTDGVKINFSPSYSKALVVAHDLDQDGFPEVIAGARHVNGIPLSVFTRTAKGASFKAAWTGLPGQLTKAILARDFDNDGDLDLFVAHTKATTPPTRYLTFLRQSGSKLSFSNDWSISATPATDFIPFSLGDLDGGAGTAVVVDAAQVRVQGLTLRGFARAVLVKGDKFRVQNLTIDDPDIAGVAVTGTTQGVIDNVKLRRLHQGAAIELKGAGAVQVTNSTLCPAGQARDLVAASATCSGATTVSGAGNSFGPVSSCKGLAGTTCK